MSRKIVQISSTGYSDKGDRREALYALDDDGQVWVIDPHDHGAQWSEIPALPSKTAVDPSPGVDIRKFSVKD